MHVQCHLHRGHPAHRRACRRPQVASTGPNHHQLSRVRRPLRPRTHRPARVSTSIGHSWSSPHPRLVPPCGIGPVRRDHNGRRLLPGRNTPDYMNRSIRSIPLQDETAAPLRIVWIVLDHEGRRDPSDDIANPHRVRRQLLESMKRNSRLATCDQRSDLLQSATHTMLSRRPHASLCGPKGGKAGPAVCHPLPRCLTGRWLPYSLGSANTTSRSFPRGSPLAGAETLAATYCRPSLPA